MGISKKGNCEFCMIGHYRHYKSIEMVNFRPIQIAHNVSMGILFDSISGRNILVDRMNIHQHIKNEYSTLWKSIEQYVL